MATYVVLAGALIATKRPWVDEAWFTAPALDLITRGRFGTLLLDPNGSHLRLYNPASVLLGIDHVTFWVMPLHLLQLAAWGRLFGFSVFSMRMPSFFSGGAAIYSTGVIVRRLYGGGMAPILAMLVLAADFGFLNGAADVRMDMTCASLGLAAVAVYLSLRERDLGRALVFAHALAGLALFTHPNGVFASANLVVLMFLLDRKRLSWGKLAAGTVPYGVGAPGCSFA